MTIVLEQLMPWQEGPAATKEAHSVPVLNSQTDQKRVRTPHLQMHSRVDWKGALAQHSRFPTGKCAKITLQFLKTWLGGHKVGKLSVPSSVLCFPDVSGAHCAWHFKGYIIAVA
jgi:hypothetical protein